MRSRSSTWRWPIRDQCLKCRLPVKTMASPCSSAAAMTSASRTDPPGCTTAVAPAFATRVEPVPEREERVGRRDGSGERAGAGLHDRHVHCVDAAHLARAHRNRAIRSGEDHGVRFHVGAHAPREPQRGPLRGCRRALRHDLRIVSLRPGLARLDDLIALLQQHAAEERPALFDQCGVGCGRRGEVDGHDPQVRLRRRGSRFASSSTDGAMTASMNVEVNAARGARVERPVERDDAAERGQADRPRARARRRRPPCRAGRHAARIGVLDDDRRPARRTRARCAAPRRDRAGWCTTAPCPGAPAIRGRLPREGICQ